MILEYLFYYIICVFICRSFINGLYLNYEVKIPNDYIRHINAYIILTPIVNICFVLLGIIILSIIKLNFNFKENKIKHAKISTKIRFIRLFNWFFIIK